MTEKWPEMVVKWPFILSFLFQNRVYITGMALVLPQHSIPKNPALPLMAWRPCYEFAQRSQTFLVTLGLSYTLPYHCIEQSYQVS